LTVCVSIPGRIVSVVDEDGSRHATVDFGGAIRTVDLVFVPEAGPGDHVIVHSGFAVRRISAAQAEETIELLRSTPPG
jgi:hydrogenase expression/formation protein HypC